MKRRQAIAAVAFVPLAELQAQQPYFSTDESAVLAKLCSLILPADDVSPAAGDTKVPWYIEQVVRRADSGTQQLWKAGLAAAKSKGPEQYLPEIARDEADPRSFFVALKSLCVEAYLYSEAGRKYLGYKGSRAVSSFPGCEI